MSDTQPLVSVITPVYNGGRFLRECLDSVLAQSYRNWECLVVDNASTDDTGALAAEYARRDSRVRVIRNDETLPIMDNWNHALRQMDPASAYCKVVHADDSMLPQCLEAMVAVGEAHPRAGLIGAYAIWGERVRSDGLRFPDTLFSASEIARRTLLGELYPFPSPSALLLRSEAVRARDPFYPGPNLEADVAACYELLREWDFGFAHQVLTYIRRHDESTTSTVAKPINTLLLQRLRLLLRYGPEFLSPAEYRRRLGEHMNRYYAMLARAVMEGRGPEFWQFHREGMRRAGLPLDDKRLAGRVRIARLRRRAAAWSDGLRRLAGAADATR